MINVISQRLLGVLLLSALAACSGKKDVPPPAVAAQPPTQAAPAPATPPAPAVQVDAAASATADSATTDAAILKKATLDCDDRSITLEATCSDVYGPRMLACSKQQLTVTDHASGAVTGQRQFKPQPGTGGDPPLVEEKIGALSCVQSHTNERYVVARMYNGGNCEECEWNELYDWDGKLVASDRGRANPGEPFSELLTKLQQHPDNVIARKELNGFYSANQQ
jgi:hypothetical protein